MLGAIVTEARPAVSPERPQVVVEPLARCMLALVPVMALWTFVRAGRLLCLLAQRVPVLVHAIRWLRRRHDRR